MQCLSVCQWIRAPLVVTPPCPGTSLPPLLTRSRLLRRQRGTSEASLLTYALWCNSISAATSGKVRTAHINKCLMFPYVLRFWRATTYTLDYLQSLSECRGLGSCILWSSLSAPANVHTAHYTTPGVTLHARITVELCIHWNNFSANNSRVSEEKVPFLTHTKMLWGQLQW